MARVPPFVPVPRRGDFCHGIRDWRAAVEASGRAGWRRSMVDALAFVLSGLAIVAILLGVL